MGTIDYESLIEKNRGIGDEMNQRKQASKLAEVARNLESLHELAEAEAKRRAPETAEAAPHAGASQNLIDYRDSSSRQRSS